MERDGIFARVNDSIRKLVAANDQNAESWEFICECADLGCHTFVTLTVTEFDARRAASPPVPILATEHSAAASV